MIPTLPLPKQRMASRVAREDAEMLTILFPIKIAESILPECSCTFVRVIAFVFPSSTNDRIFILFTVVREVSADEKKAERPSSRNRAIHCMTPEVSKYITPFLVEYNEKRNKSQFF